MTNVPNEHVVEAHQNSRMTRPGPCSRLWPLHGAVTDLADASYLYITSTSSGNSTLDHQ